MRSELVVTNDAKYDSWTSASLGSVKALFHKNDPEFGYRFLFYEAHDAGQVMSERTA